MKRIFALTLLVAFAAGPSVKWLCERMCGAEDPVAAAGDCHHPAESAQMMAGGHDCGEHASPVALLTKTVQPESRSLVLTRRGPGSLFAPSPVLFKAADVAVPDSSPPPAGFLVPLRI
jgi:hypothetical protein